MTPDGGWILRVAVNPPCRGCPMDCAAFESQIERWFRHVEDVPLLEALAAGDRTLGVVQDPVVPCASGGLSCLCRNVEPLSATDPPGRTPLSAPGPGSRGGGVHRDAARLLPDSRVTRRERATLSPLLAGAQVHLPLPMVRHQGAEDLSRHSRRPLRRYPPCARLTSACGDCEAGSRYRMRVAPAHNMGRHRGERKTEPGHLHPHFSKS